MFLASLHSTRNCSYELMLNVDVEIQVSGQRTGGKDHSSAAAYFSYFSMALHHLQSPSAAVEAFLILLGSKSGLEVYSFRILAITGAGMLSCREREREKWNACTFVQNLGTK